MEITLPLACIASSPIFFMYTVAYLIIDLFFYIAAEIVEAFDSSLIEPRQEPFASDVREYS